MGGFDQEAALAEFDRAVECLHRLFLVGTQRAGFALAQISVGDWHRGQGLALGAHVHQLLQVAAGEKRIDDACVVVLIVPEIDQFAIGKEDERRTDLLGVRQGLLLGGVRLNGLFLGLDDGQRTAALIEQYVIRPTGGNRVAIRSVEDGRLRSRLCDVVAAGNTDFGQHGRLVGRIPAGSAQLIIDQDAGVGFLGLGVQVSSPYILRKISYGCRVISIWCAS